MLVDTLLIQPTIDSMLDSVQLDIELIQDSLIDVKEISTYNDTIKTEFEEWEGFFSTCFVV